MANTIAIAQFERRLVELGCPTRPLKERVRELAEQLLVYPNTVARAFQELERLGVVTARRGRGMEVTEEAPAMCKARRQEMVRDRIRQALREAVASVLPADEIRRLVDEELAAVNGTRRPREKH